MSATDPRLDLNSAGRDALATLPGIGLALASRIVAYREAVSPFTRPGDLLQVPGISEAKLAAIRDLIIVSPTAPDSPEPLVNFAALEEAADAAAAQPGTASEAPAEEDAPPPLADGEEVIAEPARVVMAGEANGGVPSPPQRTPDPRAAGAGRPGCTALAAGVLGGMLGLLLALGSLALLNAGSLRFATESRTASLMATQAALRSQVEAMNGAMATLEAGNTANAAAAATSAVALEEVRATTAALEASIADVVDSAGDFDALISGLRRLLNSLDAGSEEGAESTPTGQPSPTATPDAPVPTGPAESAGSPTPNPTTRATPDPVATRTPRPTATPFRATVAPTATP